MRAFCVGTFLLAVVGTEGHEGCGRIRRMDESAVRAPGADYSQHGANWPGCKGVRQSPIEVDFGMLTPFELSPVEMTIDDFYQPMDLTMERSNNGIIIEGKDLEQTKMHFGDQTYSLSGFHFHADAEHVLTGQFANEQPARAAAEIHFVFIDGAGVPSAVVGVVLDSSTDKSNDFLSQMTWVPADGAVHPITKITFPQGIFKAITNGFEKGFAHYRGSLTTPDCAETIRWFLTTATMSKAQGEELAVLRDIPGGGNWRASQHQACRAVYTTDVSVLPVV